MATTIDYGAHALRHSEGIEESLIVRLNEERFLDALGMT
jgi:hypothetical protein